MTLNWPSLRRELRASELRILLFALVIAVMAVTAVNFFTDRIARGLHRQAAELLAADLLLYSSEALPDNYQQAAQQQGLLTSRVNSFSSVLLTPTQDTQLVALKAVEAGYPLRGSLRISQQAYGAETVTQSIPGTGKVWLDPRLMSTLNLQLGGQIMLGKRWFIIEQILAYEPDRGGDLFQLAPRVLMNLADLPSTELIAPASRVRYQLLIAGEPSKVEAFARWLKPQLTAAEQLQDVSDARPEMKSALERAQRFLGLAALVTVLVAGAAIAVAAQQYSRRQADISAIMRCFGAQQRDILQGLLQRLILLTLIAAILGSGLGYGAEAGLSYLLAGMFNLSLPTPSLWPLVSGLLTALITLTGFAMPSVLRASQVSVLRVLRHDLPIPKPSTWSLFIAALVAFSLLIIWQTQDLQLTGIVLGGTLICLLLLLTIAWLLIRASKRMQHITHSSWRYGIANIARHAETSLVQLLAFGIGIMALLLLAIVRVDIINSWQANLPTNAPNHFLINIQAEDLEAVKTRLDTADVKDAQFYPMVRGRLVGINNQSIQPEDFTDPRAQRLVRREFNLSWQAKARSDNPIKAGQWWQDDELQLPLASVEEGIAEDLGIKLGDQLHYQIAGQDIFVTVSNLREVEWDSFNVNFFVVTTPATLATKIPTYITSFYLGNREDHLIANLVREFPSITVFDVAALMSQVRTVMDRAILAIEYVFVFTLLASLSVLYAAINASSNQRRQEIALLRTLGARNRQILISLLVEFSSYGCLAGFIAACAANLLGFALAQWLFELQYQFNPWLWLTGMIGGTIGIGCAGFLASNGIRKQTPLSVLRTT